MLVTEKAKHSRGFIKLKGDFGLDDSTAARAFLNITSLSSETFIRSFQFKILNEITFTNNRLAKIGYVPNDLCTFCETGSETVHHLFYECPFSNLFWKHFENFWFALSGPREDFTFKDVFVGRSAKDCDLLNYLFILAKFHIWTSRKRRVIPNLETFIGMVDHIVVSGDLNCGDIDWKCDPPMVTSHTTAPLMYRLLDLVNVHALTQYVTVPTRPASLKTLDLVLSSVPSLVSDIQVKPGMSNHDIVLFNIRVEPKLSSRPPHKVYFYDKADLDTFRQDISNSATEFFAHCSNRSLEENWTFFKDTLIKTVDKHIPSKMTTTKKLPWICRATKCQMRRRDHLHQKAKRSSDENSPAWSAYRHQRNKVFKLLKTSHNSYLNQEIGGSLKENPKRFWSYIKHSRSEAMGIPTLRQGDSIFISDKDKAELLNNHFESVFTRDNGLLPTTISTNRGNFSNIGDIKFDESGVQKLLANLNISKSTGPDGISPRCLRVLSAEISGMLTFIFQQSYNLGTLPCDWSKAMVVPVHNKSNKGNPENYRPISLTCLVCKLMEHIVFGHLNKHLSTNGILSLLQHGFRAGMSGETQLVLTCHDWANILNQQGQVDALLLDFSKAFDKVSHTKLLHKLDQYGVNGKTHKWISGFLHNRTQFVAINGTHSSTTPVTSGVPQGSVLGPTLFLLRINDIVDVPKSNLRLFADDTVLYRAIKSQNDHQILQEDLHNITKWASDWQMDFNVSKCHLLRITNKRKPHEFTYSANSKVLTKLSQCDYLGIRCSETLRWDAHCSKVAAKANNTLGLIRRTLKPCSSEVKERAYMMLVRPTLEYAPPPGTLRPTQMLIVLSKSKRTQPVLYTITINLQQVLLD